MDGGMGVEPRDSVEPRCRRAIPAHLPSLPPPTHPPCAHLQADDAMAKAMALAGQERMAQMDTEEVTNFAFQMLKGYAALQRFKPKRDPRSWEVNCEDDLTRHYDRGGETKWRYLTQVSKPVSP